jgi:hypothetical protein
MIKDADTNGDGEVLINLIVLKIDYHEFIEMMDKLKV